MNAPRYITDAPAALRASLRLEARRREAAELLDWLDGQHVDFIGLVGGRGIDVANTPGGLVPALRDARRDALNPQSLEQGAPT